MVLGLEPEVQYSDILLELPEAVQVMVLELLLEVQCSDILLEVPEAVHDTVLHSGLGI